MMQSKPLETLNTCVGVITSANGIKGYVKIRYFTACPNDMVEFKNVFDPITGRTFRLNMVSVRGDCIIASIHGVKSRNEAEALQNTKLFIDREELPKPDNDEYYHTDLIDCQVRLEDGLLIGRILNVHNFGASDVLEIHDALSNKDIYYPFNKIFVKEVNLKAKYIVVSQINELVAVPE